MMRLLPLLLALVAARAESVRNLERPVPIRVCLNPGANASVVHRGEAIASRILRGTKVAIEWRGDVRACKQDGTGVLVTLSFRTPEERAPGALAVAFPYEAKEISVFFDRVARSTTSDALASVLGHVLAHELVHVLQGVAWHSAAGLMKARWDRQDYVQMQRGLLPLGEMDVGLIRRGSADFAWNRE